MIHWMQFEATLFFFYPQLFLLQHQYLVGSIRLELSKDDDYDLKTIQPLISSSCIIIKHAHSYAQTAHLINKDYTTIPDSSLLF